MGNRLHFSQIVLLVCVGPVSPCAYLPELAADRVFFAIHHIPLCQGGLQEWALVFAAFSQQTARAAWILYHMYVGSLALDMLPLGCGRLAHSA